MRTTDHGNSRAASTTPPNAFDPAFLALVQEREETLTAAEADLSGPWKVEPVPGHPGAIAVLREWESLAKGDLPEAVFLHEEIAELCAAGLPLVEREPLFSLHEVADPAAPVCPGHPVVAVFGEQGPAVCGWLRHHHSGVTAVLHTLEGLARSPRQLAAVNAVAGGGALRQMGRILAERWAERSAEQWDDGEPARA
jgi:hypothetical protein